MDNTIRVTGKSPSPAGAGVKNTARADAPAPASVPRERVDIGGDSDGAVLLPPRAPSASSPRGPAPIGSPSPGAPSTGWDEAAIARYTSRGIPIRDFRSRADRPEWQVDTRALKAWLQADVATASTPAQTVAVDYGGSGVPEAQAVIRGPGRGGAHACQVTTSDGRTIQVLSDGPLSRTQIENLARTVGESPPELFRSRYPGQGETTVVVGDHLGQFTSQGVRTDVAGLGGQGPRITLDRLLLESRSIGSLTHEWLHTFDHAASLVSRQARAWDGRPLFGPEGSADRNDFVSAYARSNPLEDFAETGEWVNDVLMRAHGQGTDLARLDGKGFRGWLTEHWPEARPEGDRPPSRRLLDKACFIFEQLDLAPDVPVCFSRKNSRTTVDPDRVMQLRRDARGLASENAGIGSVEIEIGDGGCTYRAHLRPPFGPDTVGTLEVPFDAQVDRATLAALLPFADVRVLQPEGVYVPVIEAVPREGAPLPAGTPITVVGPEPFLDAAGSPEERLDAALRYGRQYGQAGALLIHVGPEDAERLAQGLASRGTGWEGPLTLVDCEGRLATVRRAADGKGATVGKGRPFGALPPAVMAEHAAREAAARARAEALAPKRASPQGVEAASRCLADIEARLGATMPPDTREMLAMIRDMLGAPTLTQAELESIDGELRGLGGG